jgi:DNA-binding IclR family transcriptional regulator
MRKIGGILARSSSGESAVSRALRVLEAFDQYSNELSLTQLAGRTLMPVSTVHRVVAELVRLGLLERRGSDLILGVRLWEVAVRAPGVFGLRETALPYLQEVNNRLQHHAQLAILQGAEILFLERLSRPKPVINLTSIGGRMPWYATSSGFVLLANAASEARETVLAGPRPRYAFEPELSAKDVQQMLAQARREGYFETRGYIHPDATAVAAPIKGPYGMAVASLAVVVPTEGFLLRPVLEVLLPAAKAVSARLAKSLLGQDQA